MKKKYYNSIQTKKIMFLELAIALIEHFPKGIVPLGRIGT